MKTIKKIIGVVMCMVMLLGFTVTACAEATPRIIITGYTIDKEEVKGGDTFKLTMHIQNMSKKTDISNIKLTLSTPENEIVPASGSSTVYIETIAKEETIDVTVEMIARNDLESKSYVLTVDSEYEDRYSMPYQDKSTLIIPVVQNTRVSTSDITLSDSEIAEGDSTDISFTINNQGRGSLYNVNVTISGEGIKESGIFVGNVASGATGYADLSVIGVDADASTGKAQVTISYEDNAGNVQEEIKEIEITVTEKIQNTAVDIPVDHEPIIEDGGFRTHHLVMILGVIVIVVALVVRKKIKKKEEEQDEF